ncbi:hypothetical protein BRADI_5g18324v3 [Brachypodium distachyon]|uniref:Uncharacterized protein n=1 Tax=Brachypodium distachyon TaxID=15368 RepID=A0A2K2CI05_BRADI|nr:hypothetical protein BRADI_5g18324v3 [Brachypodium distachyon]
MAASSSTTGKEQAGVDLAKAMDNLVLREGELDDVLINDEEVAQMEKEARWLALARVHTTKPFSLTAFYEKMRVTWGLAYDIDPLEIDDNLFLFKFSCLGDWKKIPVLYRRESVVDQLTRRIGRVISIDLNPPKWFEGDYVRVRASIDVREPLIRFVPLKVRDERHHLEVKYEKMKKMGFFCEICGELGHDRDECGDGVHDENLDKQEDLADTASSPIKGANQVNATESPSVTRKLNMDIDTNVPKDYDADMDDGSVVPPAKDAIPPPPPAYVSPKDHKRSRKGASPNKAISNGSVASTAEDRRAQ